MALSFLFLHMIHEIITAQIRMTVTFMQMSLLPSLWQESLIFICSQVVVSMLKLEQGQAPYGYGNCVLSTMNENWISLISQMGKSCICALQIQLYLSIEYPFVRKEQGKRNDLFLTDIQQHWISVGFRQQKQSKKLPNAGTELYMLVEILKVVGMSQTFQRFSQIWLTYHSLFWIIMFFLLRSTCTPKQDGRISKITITLIILIIPHLIIDQTSYYINQLSMLVFEGREHSVLVLFDCGSILDCHFDFLYCFLPNSCILFLNFYEEDLYFALVLSTQVDFKLFSLLC